MTYRLEDMLCDCAVIRAIFDTFDLFPAHDPIRVEMQEIINDARANMRRRCAELRSDIATLMVIDRSLEIHKFGQELRTLLLIGYPRRRMDSCMKLNVFQSVAQAEAGANEPDPLYRYDLLPPLTVSAVTAMPAEQLATTLFDDLLQSIQTEAHYADKHAFDRSVFQKYVAIMFACHATTDPLFYA